MLFGEGKTITKANFAYVFKFLILSSARLIAKAKSVSHDRSWTFKFFRMVIVNANL